MEILWKSMLYVVFLIRFSNVYNNNLWCDSFSNPYLVKSVNLAFTYNLLRSVYCDVSHGNVKGEQAELLASFIDVRAD